jgi:Skp family chaperone for outer membrane proteins
MRGLVIAAALALPLTVAPVMAQTQQQPPRPAAPQPAPAPAQPPAAPTAPAPQPPAPFPQGAKIGVVNLQFIASTTTDGKAAQGRVQGLAQKKQKDAEAKAKALQANQQKLQASGSVMSEAARTQLEKEIERQQVEAQRFEQDAQAELNELQQQMQNEFQKKLLPILQQLAKEKGLHALFSAGDAGLIWVEPGIDLTLDAVKRMDALAGAAAAPPPPAAKP